MTSYVSPKTFWIIGVAAIVVIGVLLYWAKANRVPALDMSGIRRQNQAAQQAAAARGAAKAQAAKAAAEEAALAANPLTVENPFKAVAIPKPKNPF